jgi:hypothetical protein
MVVACARLEIIKEQITRLALPRIDGGEVRQWRQI